MKILLSNDDGIHADGIRALLAALKDRHEVSICAPAREQSGMAHALNVHRRMEIIRREDLEALGAKEAWSIDGTPTDCVKAYLEKIAQDKSFDAVISGINHGANLATDVLYSGTVGAALEGFLHGVSSFAVSLDREADISFADAAKVTAVYVEETLQKISRPVFFNINLPKNFSGGKPQFVFARFGKRDYLNAFREEIDADGRRYFSVRGDIFDGDAGEGTDIFAVNGGFIAVTPLITDTTDYAFMKTAATRL